MKAKQLERLLMKKRIKETSIPSEDFCTSGITGMDLAISGRIGQGIAKGVFYFFIGDSSSGKTVIAITILDEVANDPKFDEYEIVFYPIEDGALMDLRKFFSKALRRRISTADGGTWKERKAPQTVSEFYDLALEQVSKGPCIIVCDSMDALETKEEKALEEENARRRKKGLKEKQSYGLTKPKQNSARLRVLKNEIKKNGSILIIISQTRQNINPRMAMFEPRTRSGGDALKFYCRFEMWLSRKKKLFEKIGDKKIRIGQITKMNVTKNHISGWEGEIEVPIYRKVGVDDLGGMIDYLTEWGHWKVSKGLINAVEFDVKKKREDLAAYIEWNDEYPKLQSIVARYWKEIEDSVAIRRKKRHE
jgi:recA bacterial DNA recombination protein